MNFKITLLIFLNSFLAFKLQAQVKTIYLSSFGAVANDNKSDQAAFNKASDYINSRKGNTRLIITKGTYKVGAVFKFTSKTNIPLGATSINDVMHIENCSNIIIEGVGVVTVKFADSIPFGTLPERKDVKDISAHIGSLFRFINCTNITILNLKTDGNNEKFRLLQPWGLGNNPYEREHEGLFILNCQQVTVNNVAFNGFGRDGAMILQDADKIPVKDIAFTNCSFNNNGRDGFSWCGGDNVRFYKCVFKNNSMGKIQTNPGSGLDIEPERNALCTNGKMIKCEFSGNGGYALTSGYPTSSNVIFDSCTIIGNTNYAIICQSPKYTFNNCFIAGTCLLYYDAAIEPDGINFTNCTFADSMANKKVYTLNYLVATLGRYTSFTRCNFYSYKVPSIFSEIKKEGGLTKKENTYYKNCSFAAYFVKPSTWQRHAFLLSNAVFDNCSFKTKGYADFKYVLTESGRNIYEEKSTHIVIK
jgi:Right handed beta helix region